MYIPCRSRWPFQFKIKTFRFRVSKNRLPIRSMTTSWPSSNVDMFIIKSLSYNQPASSSLSKSHWVHWWVPRGHSTSVCYAQEIGPQVCNHCIVSLTFYKSKFTSQHGKSHRLVGLSSTHESAHRVCSRLNPLHCHQTLVGSLTYCGLTRFLVQACAQFNFVKQSWNLCILCSVLVHILRGMVM